MANDKLYDSVTDHSHSLDRPVNLERSTAVSDGVLTTSRSGMAEVISLTNFKDTKDSGGKRVSGSLPTALCGRIPQHPIFVPAGQRPTSSSSRC